MQVGLDVRGKHNLGESLDFYVQSELMEGENQYLCEEAGRKVRCTAPAFAEARCRRAAMGVLPMCSLRQGALSRCA